MQGQAVNFDIENMLGPWFTMVVLWVLSRQHSRRCLDPAPLPFNNGKRMRRRIAVGACSNAVRELVEAVPYQFRNAMFLTFMVQLMCPLVLFTVMQHGSVTWTESNTGIGANWVLQVKTNGFSIARIL